VSGTRGKDPGWDPLAFAVAEAHKRGLELYAWINPYRWSTASDWTTPTDKEWINKGWIITHGSAKYLNPGIKGVHDHVINVVDEIVRGYNVDGLIIDDYFYPNGISKKSDASDYQTFKDSGTSLSISDWRRQNVNTLVADIHKKILEVRPDVRFGIGPPGVGGASASKYSLPSTTSYGIKATDWQYDGQFTDPLQWMFSGSIDFISPQIYWHTNHSSAPYGPLTNWWSNAAAKAGRHHYASMSISDLADNNTEEYWREYATDVQLNRQYTQNNAPGYCLFRTAFISGPSATGLGDYLVEHTSGGKVLQPEVTWKSEYMHTYAAPANFALNGSKLTWDAVTDGNRLIRYSVYAVPSTVTKTDALGADGDGIDAQYLLGVTYTNAYTLPSDLATDHWYAVSVYDGFSHEHEAAYANYVDNVDPNPYIPTKEDVNYPMVGTNTFENIWIKSTASPWDNFTQESNGSFNRGFVVRG
ncbi:MAG: family 10 glycosylhydrolase, partial [Muribaculaceae bacterium]|nr:family 10 glycosylhydrolase [Muribaculaceae bacterium]